MVKELLNTGAASAIPSKDLIKALNISTRDFYNQVERERRQGACICASKRDPVGFYLAANKQEANNYVSQVNLTAHEMRRTALHISQAAQDLPE